MSDWLEEDYDGSGYAFMDGFIGQKRARFSQMLLLQIGIRWMQVGSPGIPLQGSPEIETCKGTGDLNINITTDHQVSA